MDDVHARTLTRPEQGVRWAPGERLNHLFEDRCDRLRREGKSGQLAVDADDVALTYDELDGRANQLARHLLSHGARSGDRIALLFDLPWRSYVGMLAVLKIGAAYVPLDPGFPPDRLKYILDDANVALVVSLAHLGELVPEGRRTVFLDAEQARIDALESSRLDTVLGAEGAGELAYIIYTSGSTGRPKGVAIEHASICNFVRVAADTYGVVPTDRFYQGMTIAFDFSVEEIWVPWMAGATLVPKPRGSSLLGADLADFLHAKHVTAMCCVPTLLATIDDDLPELRFLLVSGEACPRDLIARWHRPGRRFLNVYGPTEATVTATWAVADPHQPVTLGVPLPTYSAVILDPHEPREVPRGEVGEIALAGIGLAKGYVNRQDLTDRAFIPDFLNLANNPSGRIYRTGDLGRFTEEGQIDYLGRIDTQVKIRGYRIELTEIESVLLQVSGIAQAVVTTYESSPGNTELAAYYSLRRDTEAVDKSMILEVLRERLPGYMVPAYLDRLDVIPMLTSGKADRKSLPAPVNKLSAVSNGTYTAPVTAAEEILADVLAEVLQVEKVSTTDHFFNDLGANSLLLAHFSARLRKDGRVPPVPMREIYLKPTIMDLAASLGAPTGATAAHLVQPDSPAPAPASTASYVLCGVLQALFFLGSTFAASFLLLAGFRYASGADTLGEVLLRSFLFGTVTFLAFCLLPIAAKWLLIGRWKVQEIPVWTLGYVRFWLVKVLIRNSPLRMFVGTPVYALYLRALGAKVGRNVAIFASAVPVCTDLITIGDGTVIRKDAAFSGYRAHRGRIQTGAVTIGADVVIGEAAILDIGSSIGDGSQLGHGSSLYASQSIPPNERWHGSPAQPTTTDYRAVAPADCSPRRRITYGTFAVINRVFLVAPLGLAALSTFIPVYMSSDKRDHADLMFYVEALAVSFIIFFGAVVTGLLLLATVPRLLNLFLTPGKVYPLYSLPYMLQQAIAGMTNLRFYMELTGDSSLIVHYLRLLGYKQPGLVQTGSNFGVALKHESPFAATIGSGTMVADGLSIMNADFSNSSFKVSPTSIGSRSFFGNNIVYPSAGRTGDNCLLATKVMVPVDGPVREGVGLLGSPAFEIPRSVRRDSEFKAIRPEELKTQLRAKNNHNGLTIWFFLISRWIYTFVALVIASFGVALHTIFDVLAVAACFTALLLFTTFYFILIERASLGFRRLNPLFCSIYDRRFWRHERFWKLSGTTYLEFFNGTPFKNLVWRMLGVRVGRRVFDDGCSIPEKTIVSIGDDCTLNALSTIQCHSMEDGAFKVEGITIGAGCTVGVNGFIHYGVTMGDGAVLEPDSFLMKGEDLPAGSRFGGNPAQELTRSAVGLPSAAKTRTHPLEEGNIPYLG
ncbi:amino acid adenylation domain-containing protein [Arthrobacter crusticola]|uniref:Amino acid adenylation domain-containing protein n=2 Tax=Arthrobacter crusticola TaxID=2547960 RepID=A0A4R5U0Q9_9MICC|nr:amino acid adenylation domain-containing protein [Arthrobacter crusticola]